jgi:hypothetical protein
MTRKGQVLGITWHNLHGQAWVFGALLLKHQIHFLAPAPTVLGLPKLQHFLPVLSAFKAWLGR